MPGLDFGRLGLVSAADSEIHPRDIFSALPSKSSQYSYLRDVQGDVLDEWFTRRRDRDLVIKMNTGNGKTVVGLLILKSALNEGAGPSVYLVPDNYLANQVEATCADLGISHSREPRDPKVLAGE